MGLELLDFKLDQLISDGLNVDIMVKIPLKHIKLCHLWIVLDTKAFQHSLYLE